MCEAMFWDRWPRCGLNGARKRTRTSKILRSLVPETSASTNSAIRAFSKRFRLIKESLRFGNYINKEGAGKIPPRPYIPLCMKILLLIWLVLTLAGPLWMYLSGKVDLKSDYRTANRESAHLAPDPARQREAVIQVYAARAFNWRGIFATHCWISVKPKDAEAYMVYQVVGWRAYQGLPALSIAQDAPDRYWYNQKPKIILDIRGEKAQALIPRIDAAARAYPDAKLYTLWPGPNSNTFPAYVAREVPELGLALPSDAIGKDYAKNVLFAKTPSGTGYQFNLWGLFGFLIAAKEGIEINILGLVYGIKFYPFALLLPGIGEASTSI